MPHPDVIELRAIRQEYPEYDVEAVTLGIIGLSNDSIRRALAIGRRRHIAPEDLVGTVKAALELRRKLSKDV